MHRRQRFRVWQFAAGLCAFVLLAASLELPLATAQVDGGQEFEELQFPDGHDAASIKRLLGQIAPICRAGVFAGSNEQTYVDTFVAGQVAALTMKEFRVLPPGRGQRGLATIRQELKTQLIAASARAPRPDVHDYVNKILLERLVPIVKNPKFHYGARCNAILIVAELNQKEPSAFGSAEPAFPYAPALPILMEAAGDAKQDAVVRIPALRGVVRHVSWNNSVPPNARPNVVTLLLAVAKESPTDGIGADAQKYLQAVALEGLMIAAMNWREANTPEVVSAANDVAADSKAWLYSRQMAARVIGTMPSNVFDQQQVPEMVRALAELAVAVTNPENGPLKDFGAGAVAPPPAAPLVEAIQFYLEGIRMGLRGAVTGRGLAGRADPDTRKLIDEVGKKMDDMLAIATSPRITANDLSNQISAKRQELVQMLANQGGAAAGTAADTRLQRPVGTTGSDGANATTSRVELSDASTGAK